MRRIFVKRHRVATMGFAAVALLAITLGSIDAAVAADVRGVAAEPSIVWISDGARAPASTPVQMTNVDKTFVPAVVVVPAGGFVQFPNDDDFLHSVYSVSPTDPFDIGFYDHGPGKIIPFPNPGVVDVRCHIHGAMHGTIIVVDGPWTQTDRPGEPYLLAGVSRGRHALHLWSSERGETSTFVEVR